MSKESEADLLWEHIMRLDATAHRLDMLLTDGNVSEAVKDVLREEMRSIGELRRIQYQKWQALT